MIRSREIITQFATLLTRREFHSELVNLVGRAHKDGLVERTELYECALQSYLFAGFPAAIEGARVLSKAWPIAEPIFDEDAIRADAKEYAAYLNRGEDLYKKVYGANSERVRTELYKLSPELTAWAVTEGYGKTLSRPMLDIQTRELAIVAMLTQLGWDRQLFSHLNGALNLDVSVADIQDAILVGSHQDSSKFERASELLQRISNR